MRETIRTLRDMQIAYARECMANHEATGDSIYLDIARIHIETARRLNRIMWRKYGRS